jgi:hypothetical protein
MAYELKVPSCPTLLLFGSEYSNEQWHYVSLILSVLVFHKKKIWAINLISRNSSISLIQKQMKYNSSNGSGKSYHYIAKTYMKTGSILHNFVYDHNLKKDP